MITRNENKNKKGKRKRSPERKRSINRTLNFPSTATYSNTIASNAMSPSSGLMIQYDVNDTAATPAERQNSGSSVRSVSSSMAELRAAANDKYPSYLRDKILSDTNRKSKGTNTYAKIDDAGDVIMGGRKTRRKKRRRKTKKRRRKTKKRRRKRKTKKRRK